MPIIEKLKSKENSQMLLNEHHVTALFHTPITDSEYQDISKIQYKKQWIHNHIIIEAIEEISKELAHHNISATVLKGVHLLFDLYKDIGSRFLSDIDLLIFKKDIIHWQFIMSKLGYNPIQAHQFHGNNFKTEWCKTVGEIEINIELHTKLFFHLKNENWQIEPTHLANMNKLQSTDLILHLCGHLAFQHTFLKLYWLFDIYFYYEKNKTSINWILLKEKSIDNHLYRSVQMCLWALCQSFKINLDKDIVHLFELDRENWWKKVLTIDFLINPYENKKHYFFIKHSSKDRLSSAILYDLAWFYHYKIQKLWLE